MNEYQLGDVIQAGTAIVRVHRLDGDRAWYYGTELGEASHGSLVAGWCKSRGSWPLLRRNGKPVSAESEEAYQHACRLFPDQPWLKTPTFLERRR